MISESEYHRRRYLMLLQAVDELVSSVYNHPIAFWSWMPAIRQLTEVYERLIGDRYRE